MSKQVHCPECQSENTPGSKFCNHCGARLPKSTSVLCPRCQTPNPHNNFYCDNCGSRLHTEQNNVPPKEEPTKPEASDLPTSAKMFSLPTRDPGDTGELDPASLQNWLKDQDDASDKKESSGKLPRLSDLTPEERGKSDDLPGWLINTENEDLLIGSPDDITTEHFLHLIQDEEEREKLSGLLNDPTIAGEAANLPDWLKDAARIEQQASPSTPSAEEPQTESTEDVTGDDADWLFELDAPGDESSQPADASDETTPTPEGEVPDWLGELGPPGTAVLGKSDVGEELPAESELEGGDLPDWLMDDEEGADSSAESPADEVSDLDLFAEDVPDWMLENQEPDDSQDEESLEQEETLEDFTLNEAAATSLTGWLAEFDIEDEEAGETAVSPEEKPIEEVEAKRSLTDWLSDFDEDDLDPDGEPPETVDADEKSLPDWITDVDETTEPVVPDLSEEPETEEAAADDSFDWLSDLDQTEEEPAAEDEALDWLSDFDEIVETDDEDIVAEVTSAEEKESDDWLDVDISTDASLSTGDTGPLPDWLDDLEPASEEAVPPTDTGELDSAMEDLFGEKPKDATGELEWLDETEDEELAAESEEDDSSLTPLVGAAAVAGAAALADAIGQDDEDAPEEEPDWLSELAEFDPNEVVDSAEEEEEEVETAVSEPVLDEPEAEIESDVDIDAILEATESAEQDGFDIDDEIQSVDEHEAGDWADIDSILAGRAGDETLPDWLEQLDEISDSEIESFDTDNLPPEEIPEWVANMRPGQTGDLTSALPSALFTDSDASELLQDTGDLAGDGLPDWLDTSIDKRSATSDKTPSSWFDSEGDLEDAPAELEAILADLPPAQAPEDMLQKAEIPDWLEELKPRELTGEAPPATESRLESSGPLAGMPNTIAIEPIIAMPRAASTPSSYSISPEQVQQARLLQQLVQEGPPPPQEGKAAISARGLAGLRILVAILLLAAVALGLYGPPILKSKSPAGVPTPATAVNTAVSDAAGKTVLVAFEYTPALAGELNPEAEMLLAQINANGSPILTTSQYTAGTAVAQAITAPYDATSLGLIPGEALGLRQLGDCLGKDSQVSGCKLLNNHILDSDTVDDMADVGLIVLLTGERSSLVNWVEQVGASSDVPIVIGTTQSLEPVVVPYFATTQVAGYLNGLPATVAYQQAYTDSINTSADILYDAQSFVLLATAVILLIGGLIFGLRRKNS
jgi:hypothetical protein